MGGKTIEDWSCIRINNLVVVVSVGLVPVTDSSQPAVDAELLAETTTCANDADAARQRMPFWPAWLICRFAAHSKTPRPQSPYPFLEFFERAFTSLEHSACFSLNLVVFS